MTSESLIRASYQKGQAGRRVRIDGTQADERGRHLLLEPDGDTVPKTADQEAGSAPARV